MPYLGASNGDLVQDPKWENSGKCWRGCWQKWGCWPECWRRCWQPGPFGETETKQPAMCQHPHQHFSGTLTAVILGTFKQGVSKQGVMTFAWRPGSQYDVAATRGGDNVLASDCRAQFGLPSTRRGCRICVTVRLPVRPRGETMYWQANANTHLSVTPLLNVPYNSALVVIGLF